MSSDMRVFNENFSLEGLHWKVSQTLWIQNFGISNVLAGLESVILANIQTTYEFEKNITKNAEK